MTEPYNPGPEHGYGFLTKKGAQLKDHSSFSPSPRMRTVTRSRSVEVEEREREREKEPQPRLERYLQYGENDLLEVLHENSTISTPRDKRRERLKERRKTMSSISAVLQTSMEDANRIGINGRGAVRRAAPLLTRARTINVRDPNIIPFVLNPPSTHLSTHSRVVMD